MEAMRSTWTDERLEDFREHVNTRFDAVDQRFVAVDQRFDAVDQRFDAVDRRFEAVGQRFDAVDARFDRVETRIESLQHTTIQVFAAIMVAMVTGFVTLAGLIVAQL